MDEKAAKEQADLCSECNALAKSVCENCGINLCPKCIDDSNQMCSNCSDSEYEEDDDDE